MASRSDRLAGEAAGPIDPNRSRPEGSWFLREPAHLLRTGELPGDILARRPERVRILDTRSPRGVRDQCVRLGGGRAVQDPVAAGAGEPVPLPVAAQPQLEPAAGQAVAPGAQRALAGEPLERGPSLGDVG